MTGADWPFARVGLLGGIALAAVWLPRASSGQQPTVVARVNDHEILAAEVELIVAALPPEQLSAARAAARRLAAREVAIRRALVLDYLARRSLAATDDEVQQRFQQWQQLLDAADEDPLAKGGWNEAAIRRHFAWQIGWSRYRDGQLGEENLQKFFDQRRRLFDGTRLRVAHLLLRPAAGESDEQPLQQARQLQQQIEAGELTFREAIQQHSIGATAAEGGDIGWITATGPMDASFTAAAFALEPVQLSPPTQSRFGVHLIQCLEIEPGTRQLADVRDQVRRAAEQHLFHRLARREAKAATIQRSDWTAAKAAE